MGRSPVVPAVASADPQEQVCAICLDTVDDGESLATANPCVHQFHSECLDMWVATLVDRREAGFGEVPQDAEDPNAPTCPLCRWAIEHVRWKVKGLAIHTPPQEQAEREVPDTPDSFASIQSYEQFPVWVSIKGQETNLALLNVEFIALETATSLRSGARSMIVDPGARTNLLGSDIARRLAKRALETGHKPEQGQLKNPLTIQGVGHV